jgi:hypothetical protein
METRTDWRIVAISACAAFVLIGSAYALAAVQSSEPAPIEAPIVVGTPTPADDSWRNTLTTVTTQPVGPQGEYLAPKELPPGEAMARELLESYVRLKESGQYTPSETQTAVQNIITRHAPTLTPPTYEAGALRTDPENDIVVYAGELTRILTQSTKIKEYELKTFARSIGELNTKGSPTLTNASTIYRTIETELAGMRVPSAVVNEHLAVLNSGAALGYTTSLMAGWNGDPIFALAYIDQFVEAERDVQLSISALYRKLGVIAQKS